MASEPRPTSARAPRVKPLDWAQAAGCADSVASGIETVVRRRRQRRIALGAACALVLVAAVSWRSLPVRSAAPAAVTASTVVSSPSKQVLPDGSMVELKDGADIAVEFTREGEGLRRVVLRRGEAHFTVAKNPQRPFVVVAEGVEVRAVGTAFSVQRGSRAVEVLVTEGRVAVDRAPTADALPAASSVAPAPLAYVDAGNRATVPVDDTARTAEVQRVSTAELNERLGWRVPRLEFNATPLADVVALCNRHAVPSPSGVLPRLALADPALGGLPLSGMLRADNIPVLLQILESSYGITAEQRPDGAIVLHQTK